MIAHFLITYPYMAQKFPPTLLKGEVWVWGDLEKNFLGKRYHTQGVVNWVGGGVAGGGGGCGVVSKTIPDIGIQNPHHLHCPPPIVSNLPPANPNLFSLFSSSQAD